MPNNKLAGRRGKLFIGGREICNISELSFLQTDELRTDNFESFVPNPVDLDAVATFDDAIVDEAVLVQMTDVLRGMSTRFIRFKESVVGTADALKSFESSVVGAWYVEIHWTKRFYKVVQRRRRRDWRQKRKQ